MPQENIFFSRGPHVNWVRAAQLAELDIRPKKEFIKCLLLFNSNRAFCELLALNMQSYYTKKRDVLERTMKFMKSSAKPRFISGPKI